MGTVPVDNDVGEYRPLVLRSFQAKGARKTAEDRFWTRYKPILSGKEVICYFVSTWYLDVFLDSSTAVSLTAPT